MATLFSITLLFGCNSKTPEELTDMARKDILAGQQQQAIVYLKTALQKQPENIEARVLLAQSLQAKGEWQASEDELLKASKHGASAEQILPLRAQAQLKQGKFQELITLEIPKTGISSSAYATILAKQAMSHLATGNPELASKAIQEGEKILTNAGHVGLFEEIQLAKAGLAVYNKDSGKALEILNGVEQANPRSTEVLHIKANLFLREDKVDAALKEYLRIKQLSPGDMRALATIADIQIREGALADAGKTLADMESRQPGGMLAKSLRAHLEMRLGGEDNLRKANSSIQQVLKAYPNNLQVLALSAEINERLGNYEVSQKTATRILAMEPNQIDSALIVARSHLRQGEPRLAEEILAKLAATDQNNAKVLTLLGEAKIASGQYAEGATILKKAAALAPRSAEIAILQARALRSLGNMDEALARLRVASDLDKKSGIADEMLFQWLLERKQPEKALLAAEQYGKKFPDSQIAMNLKAGALLALNKRGEARNILENILRKDAAYYPAAANLASLDLRDGKIGDARNRFQSVLGSNPRSVDAMLALANLAAMEKKHAEYVSWMEKAIKEQPNQLPLRSRLIEHHLSTGNKKQALAEAKAAVTATPGSTAAMIAQAKTLMAIGDTERALASYAQAVAMSPKSADAAMLLGLAQLDTGNIDAARSSLENAKSLGSNQLQLHVGLLRLEATVGNFPKALAYAKHVSTHHPDSAVGHDHEGEILLRLGRFSEAVGPLRKAVALEASPNRVIRLHQALASNKNAAEADKLITDWIRKYPKVSELRMYLAEVHAKAGRGKEAITLYESVLKDMPTNVPALNNLALQLRGSDPARAISLAEKAVQSAPGEANVRNTLGQLLLDTSNQTRAIKLLEEAVQLAPGNPTFRYHLASAYAATGQRNKIIDTLRPAFGSQIYFPNWREARRLYESAGGK
ncbi:MAG: PEP-CTERM system TPR-repeat protein PrsT [Pseudomonadota bacterium]|nr:PEP-CTERM system TPR-repeat protein PrsT [Pseudomonadota bacterium]